MLSIKNLTKVYKGGKVAVDNLNLNIEAGDIFGFIGHNGAGKSTTIKAICGIIDFNKGEITVDGKNVVLDPVGAKKVTAYIPDNPDLYEHLTGMQYLNFTADVFGVDKNDRLNLISEYAKAFEIEKNLGDLIGLYSHGMKQKLAIISALIHKPKLMVLDEPFVGLDPKAAHTLKGFMAEICEQGGAIFFSTHVLEVAEKLCNKIAIIKDGALIACGLTKDVVGDGSLEQLFLELTDNE